LTAFKATRPLRAYAGVVLAALMPTMLLAGAGSVDQAATRAGAGEVRNVVIAGFAAPAPPTLGAASGILIDPSDGRVLWERASRQRRAIASTTKILTALVVIENTKPSDRVTASARAESVGSNDPIVTELELTAGETLTVEHLLYGLLLVSASDAAVALAEHVAGSVARFARMMDERARELGARDSHFTNADGLDDPNHYSTALDLSKIASAAMRNEFFNRIVATRNYQIPWQGRPQPRMLVNRNQLLGQFAGINGVKTGNTRVAGPSLVASAQRQGESRLTVLLNSPEPFRESAALLEYGFSAFRRFVISTNNRPWGQLTYGDGTSPKLVAARDVTVLVGVSSPDPPSRYDTARRAIVVELPERVTIPVEIRCSGPPCQLPVEGGNSALASFMSVFAPILAIFR
jgi:D-alanyl-D-alanine carboxypeptidase (penicillin-binding protein 5/6)